MTRMIAGIVAVVFAFYLPTSARAAACFESSIVSPTPFMGNNGEIFKLANGSVWEVKYEYEYLYEYYPKVTVCPDLGKLILKNKSLQVASLAGPRGGSAASSPSGGWTIYEETNLVGSISGTVNQGRIFKTTSGHVYEVVGLTLQLVLELQPQTIVLRNGDTYKLVVEGFDEPLLCRKLI